MAMGPYRLYLGFCWLGWGSFAHHLLVCALAVLFTTMGYLIWLAVEASKIHPDVEGVAR
jgi:hypothetical protein